MHFFKATIALVVSWSLWVIGLLCRNVVGKCHRRSMWLLGRITLNISRCILILWSLLNALGSKSHRIILECFIVKWSILWIFQWHFNWQIYKSFYFFFWRWRDFMHRFIWFDLSQGCLLGFGLGLLLGATSFAVIFFIIISVIIWIWVWIIIVCVIFFVFKMIYCW